MSSTLPPGYSFAEETESKPKKRLKRSTTSLLPSGYSFADEGVEEEEPEAPPPKPEEGPGLLRRAYNAAASYAGSRQAPNAPTEAAPGPYLPPNLPAPLPKDRVSTYDSSRYGPGGKDRIENEPVVSQAEYAIKHLPPTPGTKPYLETPLTSRSKSALAMTPKDVSEFAGKAPGQAIQTTGGDALDVAQQAAEDLVPNVTGDAPTESAKSGVPLYPGHAKGWKPTTEGQPLLDPIAAAMRADFETKLPTGEVKKGTPLYPAGANQAPTTRSGTPQSLRALVDSTTETALPTGEVRPGVPLYGGGTAKQPVNQAPVTSSAGLARISAGASKGIASALDSLASPEVLGLVVASPAVAALLPVKAGSVLSMAVTGKFGFDILKQASTERMTELGTAIESKDPQKIAEALTGLAFDIAMLIHPTKETPEAASERWRARLEGERPMEQAPEGTVLKPQVGVPGGPPGSKPGWTAGGMIPSLIAEGKNVAKAFGPQPRPLEEIPVSTPPVPPKLPGELDPNYMRPGTGPPPEGPTIPPLPTDIVIPPVGPPLETGPITTEPPRPPGPPPAPPVEPPVEPPAPPPAPPEPPAPPPPPPPPEPVHPDTIASERWTTKRRAPVGEPMAFLEGKDAETAKAAILKSDDKEKPYEAWTQDGIHIGSYPTAAEAAAAAEAFVDQPEPSELEKRVEEKRNPPTEEEKRIAEGAPPDVTPPAPGPEEAPKPEPVPEGGPPAAEGVGGEAPKEPDEGAISPGGGVPAHEPAPQGETRPEPGAAPGGREGRGAEDTARDLGPLGAESKTSTEKGTEVTTRFAIVPRKALRTSHDTGLNIRPDYPKELQPRQRERAASEIQVSDILNRLNPERLGHSPEASSGAPIVGLDAVVESGNGRVIALSRGYETGHENMPKYRQWLWDNAEKFGLQPHRVLDTEDPILVRVRTSDLDRAAFVHEANAPTTAGMSPAEMAQADAPRITHSLMEGFHPDEDGDLMVPENREFLAKFTREVIGGTTQGTYMTKEGYPNKLLIDRVTNAILAKAYNDRELVDLLTEATDVNVRNVAKALVAASGGFARLKFGIEKGSLHPLDIAKNAADAARLLSSIKRDKKTVEFFLTQDNLYAEKPDPITARILQYYDKNARSAKRITAFLNGFTAVVEGLGDPAETDLFGEAKKPTIQEALDASFTLASRAAGKDTETGDLLAGEQAGGGARAGEAGGGGAGEAPAKAGEGEEPAPAPAAEGLAPSVEDRLIAAGLPEADAKEMAPGLTEAATEWEQSGQGKADDFIQNVVDEIKAQAAPMLDEESAKPRGGLSLAPEEPPAPKPSALDFAKKFLQKKGDTALADKLGSIVGKVGHEGIAPSEPGPPRPSGEGEAPGGRGEAGPGAVLPPPAHAVGGREGGLPAGAGPLAPPGGHPGLSGGAGAGEGPALSDRGPAGGEDGQPTHAGEAPAPVGGGGPLSDVAPKDAGDAAGLSAANPGLASGDTGLQAEELSDALYDGYKPSINIPGMKPHPTKLVESAAMASVKPPEFNYELSIPHELIEKGIVSDAQLEAGMMAGAAHSKILPSGERQAGMIGDGTGTGKGQSQALVMLDNWNKGRRRHIWITENWKLLKAAARDLKAVGLDPKLLINMKKIGLDKKIPDQDGIVFTTYSTLRSAAGRPKKSDTGPGGFKAGAEVKFWVQGPNGPTYSGNSGKLVRITQTDKGWGGPRTEVVLETGTLDFVKHPPTEITLDSKDVHSIDGDKDWLAKASTKPTKAEARTRVTQLVEWFDKGAEKKGLAHGDELSPGGFRPGDDVEFRGEGAHPTAGYHGKLIRILFPASGRDADLLVDDLGVERRIPGARVDAINGLSTWAIHIRTMMAPPGAVKQPSGGGGVISFDEAHQMGNAGGGDSATGASQQAKAGLDLQKATPNARVLYVSATGATEVSNLAYAGQRLGIWGEGTAFPDANSFINQIGDSGIAGMEVVARDMKALGVYLSRSLSYDGVGYNRTTHELDEKQIADYDEMAKTWARTLEDVMAALRLTSARKTGVIDPKLKSAATSLFYGTQLRFFDQVTTAMTMPTVIKQMEESIAKGNSPVVSFTNTNEAAMERQLDAMEEADSVDDLDTTPREAFTQYVTKHFPVIQYEEVIDPKTKKPTMVPVFDSEGNPELNPRAVAMRDALLEDLEKLAGRVPDSPLDLIINHFGHENVAEVTGRKRRVVKQKNGSMAVQTRGPEDNAAEIEAFQNDDKRILVYSDAGGTGADYQADTLVKNQRVRDTMPIQMGYRANVAMQKLGRTHRSRQKQPPVYHLTSTNLPGHRRFFSTIAQRLGQLGALGQGERKTGNQGLFDQLDNLESPHARDALRRFIGDLVHGDIEDLSAREVEGATGLKLRAKDGSPISTPPAMSRFLSRILALEVHMQNKVFDAFFDRFKENIELAIENGTLDMGVENLKAEKIDKTSEQTVYTHPESKAETKYMTLDVHRKHHIVPFPKEQAASTRFIKNKRSGAVWVLDKEAVARQDADGNLVIKNRLTGPAGTVFEDRNKITVDAAKYEESGMGRFVEVTPEIAEKKWKEQSAELPEFRTVQMHLITGAILPIWNKLPGGNVRVMRVKLADGQKLLGRLIPPKELDATLARLGAKKPKILFTPKQVYDKVLSSRYHIALDNGWKVVRHAVNGKPRVELEGPTSLTDELKEAGVTFERLQFKPRFHVPSAEVLEKILEKHPIAESAPPKETGVLGAPAAPRVSKLQATAATKAQAREDGVTLTDDEVREIARRAREEVQRGEGGENGAEGGGEVAAPAPVEPGQVQAAPGKGVGDQRPAPQKAVWPPSRLPANAPGGVAGEGGGVAGAPTGSKKQRDTMAGPGKVLVTAQQIIDHLSKLAGTPIRIGHGLFAQRKAAGWFQPRGDLIRMKLANDIDTAAHEVGHSIDQKVHALGYKSLPLGARADLNRLGKELYGERVPAQGHYMGEGWAEYVAQRVRGENVAGSAEHIHRWFEDEFLPKHPDLKKGLLEAQAMFEDFDKQGAVGRIASQIHEIPTTPVEKLKDGYEKLQSIAWRKMLVTDAAPMEDAVARLIGLNPDVEIPPDVNPMIVRRALTMNAKGTARYSIFEGTVNLAGQKTGDSLADALRAVRHDLRNFAVYGVAARARVLHARGLNPGITKEDANYAVKELETPEFKRAVEEVTAWSDRILDYLVEAGGLSRENADVIRELNPIYLPFQRYFDESYLGAGGGGTGRGSVNVPSPIKKFKGSGRQIQNPLEVLIQQAEKMILTGNKMQVGRAIVEFAEKMPGSAWFANKVPPPRVPTTFTIGQIAKQLAQAGIDLGEADLEQLVTVFHATPRYFGKDNIVSIWRNGKREFWEIHPDVYRVVTDMDKDMVLPWLATAPKRAVQLGATGLNVGFSVIANPLRDAMAWVAFEKGRHFSPFGAFTGLWDELKKDPAAQQWKAGGGEMGTLMGQDRAAARRHLDEAVATGFKEKAWVTAKHPIDAIRGALGVFESSPRIATYKAALAKAEEKYGKGSRAAHMLAMYEAKDVTVDFTRMGTQVKALNQMIPFFNARIQGPSKFYRTFGGDWSGTGTRKAADEAGRVAMRATAFAFSWLTVPSILLWYANKDEEWYRELKPFEKGAFWVFSPDHGKTRYRIPKPQELGYVFATVPEALLDYAYRKNSRGVADAVFGTIDSLLPFNISAGAQGAAEMIPAFAKPLLEFAFNYDTFKKQKIVDTWLEERKLPKDQYQKYTTHTAIQLGKLFNISPAKLEHVISGYTGGTGLSVLQAWDLATGHRKKTEGGGLADIPVLSRFALRNAPGVSVDDLYQRDAFLTQKRGSKALTLRERVELHALDEAKRFISDTRQEIQSGQLTKEEGNARMTKIAKNALRHSPEGISHALPSPGGAR